MNLSRRGPLVALAVIAAGIAVGVFKVPLSTVLLFALVLACPLMMAGMHGGHGGDIGHTGSRDERGDQHQHDRASQN